MNIHDISDTGIASPVRFIFSLLFSYFFFSFISVLVSLGVLLSLFYSYFHFTFLLIPLFSLDLLHFQVIERLKLLHCKNCYICFHFSWA